MNIYIGNLSYKTTEDELKQLFSEYGNVSSASIINDRETGRSKGFGFVVMDNQDEASTAIESLNEKEFGGRALRINEARSRK